MFSSLGLFKHISCPKQEDCDLPLCIFSHSKPSQTDIGPSEEYDPFSEDLVSPPPAKRLKIDHAQTATDTSPLSLRATVPQAGSPDNASKARGVSPLTKPSTEQPSKTNIVDWGQTRKTTAKSMEEVPKPPKPTTATRPISPPPTKSNPSPTPLKKEPLVPRNVPSQPVQFKKRHDILRRFHVEVQSKDTMSAGGDMKLKALMLSEQEAIKFALDFEEEAARKYDDTVYQSHLGGQMVRIKKMTAAEWRLFVKETIRKEIEKPAKPVKQVTEPGKRPTTGLSSLDEEVAILKAIRTSLAGLDRFGYVTSPPTAQEVASAKAAGDTSGGFEQCDRCNSRFRVFPGRDEDGDLTSGGTCRYHWAKPNRPTTQKTDRNTGAGQVSHPCCSQLPGSQGCSEADTHVFNVKDIKRLATIWQWENTPANSKAVNTPVSFDCEMGYTTLGMEVIRVTAVSWPAGKDLLDVLVRPYGEILDLNSRFSGVTQKQFASAVPYGENVDGDDTSEDGELEPEPLRKVESPAAARQLLFDLIAPDTPLLGHAIDNDLNTLRIIHPLIVDTVLLYPHPRGLPIRYSLKILTRQHLERSIQISGAAGHDSKEDAIATADLVTLKVAEKWKQMKAAGWKFEDAHLVPPESKMPKAAL